MEITESDIKQFSFVYEGLTFNQSGKTQVEAAKSLATFLEGMLVELKKIK